jgi:hypothetical protein
MDIARRPGPATGQPQPLCTEYDIETRVLRRADIGVVLADHEIGTYFR